MEMLSDSDHHRPPARTSHAGATTTAELGSLGPAIAITIRRCAGARKVIITVTGLIILLVLLQGSALPHAILPRDLLSLPFAGICLPQPQTSERPPLQAPSWLTTPAAVQPLQVQIQNSSLLLSLSQSSISNLMYTPLFIPPLRTSGRYIIDANGKRFKLSSVNWYGASDELFVAGGLDVRHRSAIAALIRSLGFNSVRMPYSDELVLENPIIAPALLAANPDLIGKRALDVLVATVEALTDAGLAVIINDHITQAGWCDGKNLCDAGWSNSHLGPFCRVRQTEDSWIENWETLMRRFVDNPGVIGADLRNEPRGIWGTTSWSSWAAASTRAGDRLLALQPDWLIIVEGLGSANDLTSARDSPIVLSVPHRLVYSVHVFAWSGWGSLSPYSSRPYPGFVLAMYRNWAYLLEQNIAPVWIAELGASKHPGKGEKHYWSNLMRYLETVDADFGYWAINPRKPHENEKEYWALVDDDWTSVIEDYRLESLRKLMKGKPMIEPGDEKGAAVYKDTKIIEVDEDIVEESSLS